MVPLPVFVSFEGLDGSGKSTQAERLREALADEGREVVLTREPGGTELGEKIRTLLLDGGQVTGYAEAALFAAARAELVERVIRPALERGADVISDRYLDSSLAYQGIARGLGVEPVLELNLQATRGLLPDRTILLLLDPVECAARSGATDRIEREGGDFRARVDAAYRELAERFQDRILAFDGSEDRDSLARSIRGRLRDLP
jgi:dTMP kinase